MKKLIALSLGLLLMLSLTSCGENKTAGSGSSSAETVSSSVEAVSEQEEGRQTAEQYTYELAEGEEVSVENTVFEQDVTVSGDNAFITFTNCEFKGDIINTANLGTQVIISESVLNGKCIFKNDTKEATMELSFPKFLIDSPAEIVCDECIGAVISLGDFETVFNGETYTLEDSELYIDLSNAEAGFVPYEGQEANYYSIAQWWENGEKILLTECEYDPNM